MERSGARNWTHGGLAAEPSVGINPDVLCGVRRKRDRQ